MAATSDAPDVPLAFVVHSDGAVLRIAVHGELDLACTELFDCVFDLSTDGIDTVSLDLSGLGFCDVAGVNALTGLCSFHQSQGRVVHLVDVVPQVRRLMALVEQAASQPRGPVTPA